MEIAKILIVDENVNNIQLVANVLKNKTDYSVLHATSAKEAFKLLGTHAISLILLDFMMSETDGHQVAKEISSNPKTANIPIIFLTANTDENSLTKVFEAGGQDYITKPFNSYELINRVKTHVKLYQSQKKFIESNEEFETIFNTNRDGIAIVDLETNFLSFNQAYLKMTGFQEEELLTKSCIELSAPKDISRSIDAVKVVLKEGFVENFEKACLVKEGKKVQVNMSLALMPDKNRILISARDIIEAKALEKKMRDYMRLVDKYIITSTTDLDGNMITVSKAFCIISGYTESELLGNTYKMLICNDTPDSFYKNIWEVITQDIPWAGEMINQKKDGSIYWIQNVIEPTYDTDGKKIGYHSIGHDITDKKRIEEISITDKLTGLYNRLKLDEIYEYEISQSKRYKTPMSIMLIDIDYFKKVNDTYGHQVGDSVLQEVTLLMQNHKRATDSIGRWGGEEFLIILPKADAKAAMEAAEKIRAIVEKFAFSVVQNKTISIGVSEFQEGDNEDTLLERADKALYKAKENGRNRIYFE